MSSPSLAEWRHAVTVGDLGTALAGVEIHPAMTPRQDWPRHSALVDAIHLNATRLVRALLRAAASRGEDLNVPDAQGKTVLDRVLVHQHQAKIEPGTDTDVVPWLLISGARPEASQFWTTVVGRNDPGYLKACLKAYPVCHPLLRAANVSLSVLQSVVGLAPEEQGPSLVRRLLRAGVDPTVRDPQGITPWMGLVDPEVLAEALAQGVDLQARDAQGRSLLHHLIGRLDGRLSAEQHALRLQRAIQAHPGLLEPSIVETWLDHWPTAERQRQAHLAVFDALLAAHAPWSEAQRRRLVALPGLPEAVRTAAEAQWCAEDRMGDLQTRPAMGNRPRWRV